MPSKKKSSKTPSKTSIHSISNRGDDSSPSSATSPFNHTRDEQFASALDEASARFPSLISRDAFVGRVVDNDSVSNHTRGFKIWLSESSMVSTSIAPGSLVSVSLPSLGREPGGFPLSAISDEFALHFGIELKENLVNEAGKYFALAMVFPSDKVLKNGVRLSSNVSYTLGSPTLGRVIFVHPVTEIGNNKQCGGLDGFYSLSKCKDLHLSLVHSHLKSELEGPLLSHPDVPKIVTNFLIEYSTISSPKTPSFPGLKPSSPRSSESFVSNNGKLTKTRYLSHTSVETLDVKEILGDDSSRNLLETCAVSWLHSQSLLSGNFIAIPMLSRLCLFQVVGSRSSTEYSDFSSGATEPKDTVSAFFINQGTQVHFSSPENLMDESSVGNSFANPEYRETFEDKNEINLPKLGGLSVEYAALKEIILQLEVSKRSRFRPLKGVLLHGPPGTGKSTLARVCARDAGVNLFCVNGPEIFKEYQGETESALHELFDKASKAAPAVVLFDEFDSIAPALMDGGSELGIVATLLTLMDGVTSANGILVIATTNRPDSINSALRRPGRLDREIKIDVPSPGQRHEILLAILSGMRHSLSQEDIQHIALVTHGFVGADLDCLCNKAAVFCQQRCVREQSEIVGGGLENETHKLEDILRVTAEDFEKARIRVRPSAMREVALEVPNVRWEDVGGQSEVKQQLIEAVEWPLKYGDVFKRLGGQPPSGILLHGPPGCSKTLLARAVASVSMLNFLAIKGPELFSKWVGESEKAVRSVFAKARANAPSIIFFDELDGLAKTRGVEGDGVSVGDRVITQLLVELNGLQERGDVTAIAATNRPDKIDPALLRTGRIDRKLYVGPPNLKDREDIFRIHLRKIPCDADVCIDELARLTEGYTGADIYLICDQASTIALEEDISACKITMEHLKAAIRQVPPSEFRLHDDEGGLTESEERRVRSKYLGNDELLLLFLLILLLLLLLFIICFIVYSNLGFEFMGTVY